MSDAAAAGEADLPVLHFPEGIPGFPDARRFVLMDLAENSAFQLLQSVEQPELSMVVAVPWLFFPEYTPELPEADQRDLGLEEAEDAIVFCAVTLDPDEETLYVNLLGPFIVNVHTRRGRQVVLHDPTLPLRAAVDLGAT